MTVIVGPATYVVGKKASDGKPPAMAGMFGLYCKLVVNFDPKILLLILGSF